MNLFPNNPTNGMIYNQGNGVVYQYDASIKSWIRIASDNVVLPLATAIENGAMTSDDYKKLNRLLIPPPVSSIVGNDCQGAFRSGAIGLYSGDNMISVSGQLDVQNINNVGDHVSEVVPFKIHQHTYGFDFNLNVPELIAELEKRGQIVLTGAQGQKGDRGEDGSPGINGVLSGPPGDKGESGSAPDCNLTIEPEVFPSQVKTGLKSALTNVRVIQDPVDDRNYALEFDRQVVGNKDGTATQFKVRQIDSTWVLAISASSDNNGISSDCGVPGERRNQVYELYYIDIAPIIETVHNKYVSEVQRLKRGYEDIVSFWVHKMSDMFDEQKDSLCCALERCISGSKNADLRKHMETLSAMILGKGKLAIHGRDSAEAVKTSSSQLLGTIGGSDICGDSKPAFPPAEEQSAFRFSAEQPSTLHQDFNIDPLLNSSIANAIAIDLPSGDYIATIVSAKAQVNGLHRNNVRIRYTSGDRIKSAQFLDKGSFESLIDAQSAYEGLSVSFKHDGGKVEMFLPSINTRQSAGSIVVRVVRNNDRRSLNKPDLLRYLTNEHNIAIGLLDQDYIITKAGVDIVAWPSFGGLSFAPLPDNDQISFEFSHDLNDLVMTKFADLIMTKFGSQRVLFPVAY